MSTNSTTDPTVPPRGSTIVIAIVVPAVIVIVLAILIVTAFIIPRLSHDRTDFAALKAERMKQRLDEIDSVIKTQHYYDWLATQKEKNGDSLLTTDPVCAICLEEFDEDAQIRGLRCSHAFHAPCLDEWFSRFNEYCPLCHRTIIPGKKVARKKVIERPLPVPIGFMA